MRPDVLPFRHTGSGTWSYLVLDPDGGEAALVDPVLDYDAASGRTGTQSAQALVDAVRDRGASVRWLLETHAHADHVSAAHWLRSEEHTSELQSLMRSSYAVFCLKKKKLYLDTSHLQGITRAEAT